MAVIFRKPVGGPRIVPFGQPRTSSDYLQNGHPGFRVTTRFADWDAIFHKPHLALDLANYYCGDRVVAMDDGIVSLISDPNGALGVRVSHSNGYKTEYWHLMRRVVKHGQRVSEGALLGYVGKTGLNVNGCHLHLKVLDPQNRPVDPWPLMRTGN